MLIKYLPKEDGFDQVEVSKYSVTRNKNSDLYSSWSCTDCPLKMSGLSRAATG